MKKILTPLLIFIGLTSSLGAQSIWETMDKLLLSCPESNACDCFGSSNYSNGYTLETVCRELVKFKKTAGKTELERLKSYYDKIDATYTNCWLGHFAFPQTVPGPIHFDWITLYYSFESAINYIELNLSVRTPSQNMTVIKKKISNISQLEKTFVREYARSFYNQRVFNMDHVTLVFSMDAEYLFLKENIRDYEELLFREVENYRPQSVKGENDKLFAAWRSILFKAGKKDRLRLLIEEKKQSYFLVGRGDEYQNLILWLENN